MKTCWIAILLLVGKLAGAQENNGFQLNLPPEKMVRPYELPSPEIFYRGFSADRIKAHVDTLASWAMQGRETGEAGQRMAADYIAAAFKDMGLPPQGDRNSFFQRIVLSRTSWAKIGVRVGDRSFRHKTDFYVYADANPDLPQLMVKELVFVGYGIEQGSSKDYAGVDVRGKAVLMFSGEPMTAEGKSVLTGGLYRTAWSVDWKKKVKLAKAKGAAVVFIVDPQFNESLRTNRRALSGGGWKPDASAGNGSDWANCLFVSPEMADALLGEKAEKVKASLAACGTSDFKPARVKVKMEVNLDKDVEYLEGSNVVGVIEGSDPLLKKEYVMVTAHYDHLGSPDSSLVYFGADDNGSGTAGVIEIARAFSEAWKAGEGPKRTVVCMLVSGEEKGLLGSRYYVDFPLFPLDRTVVDVNIDMIGRVDDRHKDKQDYIYVIGSNRMSSELHIINEMMNREYTRMELDYTYNDPKDPNRYYERSDHYSFAEKGIPAIFYFNGTHPDYHRPTDTANKIDAGLVKKRAQLAFLTAWEVANRPVRLSIDMK